MLVFSLTCEKSNSRTDENCIFLPIFVRKKDYVCRTWFECPAARTAGRTPERPHGPPNGPDAPPNGPDGPPNGPDGPPNGPDGPPNGPDSPPNGPDGPPNGSGR